MEDMVKKGAMRLKWAYEHMPVLKELDREYARELPLGGLKVGMALHVEAKTGMLAVTLANAGAEVRLASCNPLSTDDSVAAALAQEYGLKVYAKKFESGEDYYANLNSVLDMGPDLVIDDGADLITLAHTKRTDVLPGIKGGNEETTTGVVRLRAMAADGKLRFPVLDVNDAKMKYLFDNRYGTGQSAFDGWMNATNLIVAGKHLVVAGYGWCGKGVAMRAKGLGAIVTVTEVDPVKAIEARMDGFDVAPMARAAADAEIIITATGCKGIVGAEALRNIRDGCVLGNVGHFDNEIDKKALEEMSEQVSQVRDFVTEYRFRDGRRVCLIAEGRLMNLAAGQGHPAEIMDGSFATQAMGIVHMAREHMHMEPGVYRVPDSVDDRLARIKLRTLGIEIDTLTDEQRDYINSWQEGTRLRILMITDSFYPTTDGVATAVEVTRRALAARGHEVSVIAPDPGEEDLRLPGVIYFRSRKFRKYEGYYLPVYPSEQTAVVRGINPDIIHIRGVALMALKALFAAHNTHIPTVLTYDTVVTEVIGMYSPIKLPKETLARLASIYLRNLLKRPGAVLVPTPSAGRELESMGVRTRRTEVVPTGIDGERFRFSPEGRARVRAVLGAGDRKVLLFVGRLSFEKHAEVLIRALPLLPADTMVVLAGDGPARASLEREAAGTGAGDRVHFAGYVHGDDLVDFYSSADAFVTPSVFETQGFTVIEAMFCGLPVACGNGRAFTDFIEDGRNGYLFDPVPEKCAEAALRALSAPGDVRRRSAETAASFGIGPCTDRLVRVYESVIAGRAAAGGTGGGKG